MLIPLKIITFYIFVTYYYPISTLPEHLHSTILCTPKLPENTHKPMETSFHPPLTLVPLLANYPHSHYSPPFLGGPTNTHPFLVIPSFGVPGVGCAPGPLLYFVRSPLPYGFKATGVYLVSFYRGIQCLLSCLNHILPNVVHYTFFREIWWGGGGGGGVMNLVYGSSSSSYVDCKVFFGDECFKFSPVWGSFRPVLLHRRLRRWPRHLWKLRLRFNHLQDEY